MSLSSSNPGEPDTTPRQSPSQLRPEFKSAGAGATENVSCIYSEQFAPSVLPEGSQESLEKRQPKGLGARLHYLINYPPVLSEESTQLAFHNLKILHRH